MFQLYIRGDPEALSNRHMELAKETGTFLFYGLEPTMVPGVAMTEVHCWENAMRFDIRELSPFVERLLSPDSVRGARGILKGQGSTTRDLLAERRQERQREQDQERG